MSEADQLSNMYVNRWVPVGWHRAASANGFSCLPPLQREHPTGGANGVDGGSSGEKFKIHQAHLEKPARCTLISWLSQRSTPRPLPSPPRAQHVEGRWILGGQILTREQSRFGKFSHAPWLHCRHREQRGRKRRVKRSRFWFPTTILYARTCTGQR